jgi:hypothetical protein
VLRMRSEEVLAVEKLVGIGKCVCGSVRKLTVLFQSRLSAARNESWTDGGMTDGDGDDAFVSVSACAIHIVW